MTSNDQWFEDETDPATEDVAITEYDIVASPNDFNVKTLFDFIDSGVVRIPPFQRNFVWDLRRASKLIESLIMGLPIPQVFLYEKERNNFLVIDGQQRLLSLYYFMKLRFPRQAKRTALRRRLLEGELQQPDSLLADNEYFTHFKLSFPHDPGSAVNPLDGLDYQSLGPLGSQFDLRTLRIVIVKQMSPEGADSIYEIFNRLNTGGVNLSPQEIRMSMFHSPFLEMLARINFDQRWRRIVGREDADLHLRDVEFLLRGLALTAEGDSYSPSMIKFLNGFARRGQDYTSEEIGHMEQLLEGFFDACEDLPASAFNSQSGKFAVSIFDAVFAAVCENAYQEQSAAVPAIAETDLQSLKTDSEFIEATQSRTTGSGNVQTRISKAREHLIGS